MDRKKSGILACGKCAAPACLKTYSGQPYCETHFIEMFDTRVRASVREFSMINPREHVGVAVSGGKDSLVMLRQLAELKKRLPMKLTAILVDEGIAGYRNKTIPAARKECKRLGIPLEISSFKKEFGKSLDQILKTRKTMGACTYCGVFRRTLLQRAAKRLGVDKLAMGHNLDDAAQTVLMNLMRNEPARLARFGPGTGDSERSPILHPNLIPRIQPLIRCPEKEVALYAVLSGIDIHFMSCPNAEEAMRQQVRKLLNEMEERYPGTKARIFNAFLEMRPALQKGMKSANAAPSAICPSCGDMSSGGRCASCQLLTSLGLNV